MCLIIEPVYSCEGSSTSIVDQVKVGKNNRVILVKVILDTYTVTQQDGILHGRGDITFGQDCANYIVHPSTSAQVVVVVKPLQQGVSVDHLAVPSATLDSELMCAQVSDA